MGNADCGAELTQRPLQRYRREGLEQDFDTVGTIANRVRLGITSDDERRHIREDLPSSPQELSPGKMRHGIVADQDVAVACTILQSGPCR